MPPENVAAPQGRFRGDGVDIGSSAKASQRPSPKCTDGATSVGRRGGTCGKTWGGGSCGATLLFVIFASLLHGIDGFTINSMEHRPTYGENVDWITDDTYVGEPIDVRGHILSIDGDDPDRDSSVIMSRYTYVGCFKADLTITTTVSQGFNVDPNECLEECKNANRNIPTSKLLIAVHLQRCACVIETTGIMASGFRPSEDDSRCEEFNCKYYGNPLCGGTPDYWGVFREYDYQSLSAQGAYDPWRYIFYTVVAIREKNIQGGFGIDDGVQPERYFLHAVDTVTGDARFEFQMELSSYMLYGVQYDITSSRLIALATTLTTGRMRSDVDWTYKLATIYINTTLSYRPRLQVTYSQNMAIAMPKSSLYMGFSGASAILSILDIFVFTQVNGGEEPKREWRDQVYFIRIEDAFILREEGVDFKIEQLFANEKYGDVSAIGPRFDVQEQENFQTYVYLARVYYQDFSETTQVDWRFNPVNPEKLASDGQVGDFQIYPGLSVSEHLFNKTGIAYRYYPPDPALNAFTIYEVNIRTNPQTLDGARNWCNEEGLNVCQGTIEYTIPYAGIYNREPGIPLSLKSPKLISARFTIDALTIEVDFDRNTLKGALQIDENGDYVPDYVNDSYVPLGSFDCGRVFDEASVMLIGPYNPTDPSDPFSSSCLWSSDTRIQITLPRVLNISVGDSVFLLKDTIYAVPLGYPNNPIEWSPASTGGIQVDIPHPDNLFPPVPIVTGATQIDECASVDLNAADSSFLGKWQEFKWERGPSSEEAPNPLDMTNNPFRVYDQAKLQQLDDMLAGASELNNMTLKLPANLLEAASTYKILLTIWSRWGLNTTKELTLTKLSFAAPSVFIRGEDPMQRRATQDVALIAEGVPSACADESTVLAYRWICTSGNLNFEDYPQIPQSPVGTPIGSSLTLNAFTMMPPTDDREYEEYNFTVECYVDTPLGDVPEKTATDSVSIRIFKSPIKVVFARESRMITRDDILVLDARATQDPDFPTPEGQTFRGTFTWKCLSPQRTACFGGPATGELENIQVCRQDIGEKIVDGGETFFAPLFDDLTYCRYARGVLMFKTNGFETGEYKFTVTAESFDGRTDSLDVFVEVTEVRVPKIVLSVLNPQSKYSITNEIKIIGTEEGTKVEGPRTYSWAVLLHQSNPAYNPELAAEQDPTNPYTVDPFIFKDVTDKYNTTDANRFRASPESPDLLVRANVLTHKEIYRFRLLIDVGEATGFSDITIETAGGPPEKGRLECTPFNATMDTPRVIEAPDWTAPDPPVSYYFGYFSQLPGSSEPVKTHFTTGPDSVSSIKRNTLPIGEASTNYTLVLFVEVSTPYGATTEKVLTVQSLPPENQTQALIDAANTAETADGSEVLNALDSLLSLDPTDPDVMDSVLDILSGSTDSIPQQISEQQKAASLLATLVGNGKVDDDTMDVLERLVVDAAAAGSFLEPGAGEQLGGTMFNAMGGLMPGGEYDPFPATGQSVSMARYKHLNPDFSPRAMGMSMHPQDLMNFANRKRQKDPPPADGSNAVYQCDSPFCDIVNLVCVTFDKKKTFVSTCCGAINGGTLCNEPPCWFKGLRCPVWKSQSGALLPSPSAAPAGVQNQRRLQMERARKRKAQRPQKAQQDAEQKGMQPSHLQSTWFESWKDYNIPLQDVKIQDMSDWERTTAFYGWHPDIYERRLQYANVNLSQSAAERVAALERDEKPVVLQAQQVVREAEHASLDSVLEDATGEIAFYSMSPKLSERLRAESVADENRRTRFEYDLARNNSQRITRIVVMRDTIAKQLITNLLRSEVLKYETSSFTLYIGKTTNMSNIHPSFVFPKAFQVPADSPDEPTPDNNITGFSFQYVEYKQNIYFWSDSNPTGSNQSQLVTLIIWKANTMDFDYRQTPEPIRVYADMELYSTVECLYWDRFAPNTAGGSWSTEGVVNDARGCITTHLSDIGIFIDGKMPKGSEMIDDAARWEREVWESTCIACGDSMNYVVVAVLGMVLFTNMLLIMLGYVVDETKRTDSSTKSRYHFDGDGLTSPMNLDDPIAYSLAGDTPFMLIFGTVINVVKREHALISPVFYHENFTRPQRLQCFLALAIGLLAVNATVHSHPGFAQEQNEWFIPGILSGLLLFPIYCCFVVMFNVRPREIKKKLIKKSTSTREVDFIRQQRDKLAQQTALMPDAAYVKNRPPIGQFAPGDLSVLNIPAPLPLPPLPGAKVGGRLGATGNQALPPLPAGLSGVPGSGLAGMGGNLALPALPGMTANLPLPPPPRYPPPPKGAQLVRPATKMPPLEFPKVGQPPNPFLQLPAPAPPDTNMTNTNKALLGAFDVVQSQTQSRSQSHSRSVSGSIPGETGATPLALPSSTGQAAPRSSEDSRHNTGEASTGGASPRREKSPTGVPVAMGPGAFGGTGRPPDAEATPPLPGTLEEDAKHGMPASESGFSDPSLPRPSGPSGSFTPPGGPGTPTGGGIPSSPTSGGDRGPPGTPPSGPSRPGSARTGSFDRGAGVGSFSPASTAREASTGRGVLRLPPAPSQLVPMGDGPMPLFIRAEPPSDLKAPFAPTPIGPMGLPFGKAPRPPLTYNTAPVPSVQGFAPGAMPLPPLVVPPPPPPPREEDAAFVRRIRYTYFDKVSREHDKYDLLEDQEELGTQTPGWVYDTMTFMPYVACCTFTLASIFVVLAYGVKFARWQEEYWIKGSLSGLGLVLGMLEVFRILMMTLVELRKFENRKKAKAGIFLPRRVPDDDEKGRQIAPPPRLYKNATARPKIPDRAKIAGPKLLPKMIRGPGAPPIAPPEPPRPPPKISNAAIAFAGGGGGGGPPVPQLPIGGVGGGGGRGPSGTLTPNSGLGGTGGLRGATPPRTPPRSGATTPPGGGTPTGQAQRPPMPPRVGEQIHASAPPGSMSPHSAHSQSLHSLNHSMNMQVKAGASRHPTPPPPPGRSQGQSPARGGGIPPPPPADRPPSYSRPSSAGSVAKGRPPPTPPPRP